jgi:hypothetical protein
MVRAHGGVTHLEGQYLPLRVPSTDHTGSLQSFLLIKKVDMRNYSLDWGKRSSN